MRFLCLLTLGLMAISSVAVAGTNGSYVPGEMLLQVAPGAARGAGELAAIEQALPGIRIEPVKVLSERLGIWLVSYESLDAG